MNDAPKADSPPAPQPPRQTRKLLLGAALALALLVLAISALRPNYETLFRGPASHAAALDVARVRVDALTFADYFTVEGKEAGPDGRTVVLTLKRAAGFPLKDSDYAEAAAQTGSSLQKLLALEAVARGYVRCELFDARGDFLGFTFERIRGLQSHETVEVALPLPERGRPARIVITY